MIVLNIGTDRKIFEEGSTARARMIAYGTLFRELHIIVFTLRTQGFVKTQIAPNVWAYPTNSRSRFLYPFDARKLFIRECAGVVPDVVTTQDPFETGIAGWLIARGIKKPLHVQIHTDFLSPYFKRESLLNYVRPLIARFILPRASAIRAVSGRVRDSLSKINPRLPARTTVLPIYTDVSRFVNAEPRFDLHKKYPQFSFIILMVSRLTSEKNIRFAFSIMRELVIKYPSIGLVLVGDGPEKQYLRGLALKLHLDRHTVFEGWQDDLPTYYKTADVLLITSYYEGYGLTMIEALASGCPVVASNVGIAPEVIVNGKNGFVCKHNDSSAFMNALRSFLDQGDMLENMKDGIRKHAATELRESFDEYLNSYKKAIEAAFVHSHTSSSEVQ